MAPDAPVDEAVMVAEPAVVAETFTAAEPETAFEPVSFAPAALPAAPAEFTSAQEAPGETLSEPVPASDDARIAPARINAEALGTTFFNYLIGESEAFAAHMRALAGARSMADLVRIQIGEFQRAANASLTCWGVFTLSTSRTIAVQ